MGGHAYIPRGRVSPPPETPLGSSTRFTGEGIHSAIVSGQAAAAAILETSANPGAPSVTASGVPTGRSLSGGVGSSWVGSHDALAASYSRHLRPLAANAGLFPPRAARHFYTTPERGFRVMRMPLLRSLVLKTYADGLPHTRLLTTLARLVA